MKETYIIGTPHHEDSIIAISYHKRRPGDASKDGNADSEGPTTYEEAISAIGFGKFNVLLLFITIPSALASICATTSISFILSEAQCDLNLTLEDKGMLNAITYIGMITSAFLWGVIGDSMGRRTVLLYSYGLDSIVGILASMSQTKWFLMVAKFCCGFVMSGPVAVFMCYISEFHSTTFRPQLITIVGVYYGIARTMLPLMAWGIFPQKYHFTVIEDLLEFNTWQIYLLFNCIPSILAACAHYYYPETPKFLMSKGRYEEAMNVFRKIYTVNTGNPPESLPFSELTDSIYVKNISNNIDTSSKTNSSRTTIHSIIQNVKPLFLPPYLFKTFLMCGILFGGLLGGNTLRLWLPQIFTAMDNYLLTHNATEGTFCEMMEFQYENVNQTKQVNNVTCTVPTVTDEFYINNTIVPVCSILGYFVVAAIVTKLGKKFLLVCQYTISGFLIIGNYWSTNTLTTVILSSMYLTFFSICATTATGIAVELFPTNMRTMATSIFLLCGRIGSIMGNTLFPVLLLTGCLPPFLFIGGFMFVCAILALMLPGTENKPLR